MAKELGRRPVGDGKYRRVAELPFIDLFRVEFTTLDTRCPWTAEGVGWARLSCNSSDLHFYGTPGREYFDFVVRRCMADGVPDLLVLSGDIIDDRKYLDWIEPVLSPLRWNVAALAILGNHDWWQDFDAVRKRLAAARNARHQQPLAGASTSAASRWSRSGTKGRGSARRRT